ncbi:TauD/TfdA family dioxygenase [Microdochium nivale]|nr:TauD/TfdA family dioxygenase [Microdochium nivale]
MAEKHYLEQTRFVIEVDDDDIYEIERALEEFKGLELDGDEVCPDNFQLPSLQARLDLAAKSAHRSSGYAIIRGLNPAKYSVEDNTIIFLGISSYIGDQRGIQNPKGLVLSHVTELKSWTTPRERRHGIHTNRYLPFHTDMGCSILAMHVRSRASSGGELCLVSSEAIRGDLQESDPELLTTLKTADWPVQVAGQRPPYVLAPLLQEHAGRLVVALDPARIGPHPAARAGLVPKLRPAQHDALAAVQKLARKHQLKIASHTGDMIYINNWSLLHGREEYDDDASSARHVVRLWIHSTKLASQVPSEMQVAWDAAFGFRALKVLNRYYPVAPLPEYMEPKYSNGTAAFVVDDDDESNDWGAAALASQDMSASPKQGISAS